MENVSAYPVLMFKVWSCREMTFVVLLMRLDPDYLSWHWQKKNALPTQLIAITILASLVPSPQGATLLMIYKAIIVSYTNIIIIIQRISEYAHIRLDYLHAIYTAITLRSNKVEVLALSKMIIECSICLHCPTGHSYRSFFFCTSPTCCGRPSISLPRRCYL